MPTDGLNAMVRGAWVAARNGFDASALGHWLVHHRIARAQARPAVAAAPVAGPRRLYVDLSIISRGDSGTGIQRVVREIASRLMQHPAAGWQVVPVAAGARSDYRRVDWPLAPPGPATGGGEPMRLSSGDVFLGLDFATHPVSVHRRRLRREKARGGQLWFLLYDTLPLDRPEWFSPLSVLRYRRWLHATAELANGYLVISEPARADLRRHLARLGADPARYTLALLPMGADLSPRAGGREDLQDLDAVLHHPDGAPSALMVGTLEPRKGHARVLDAFEHLWATGSTARLVIVGRPGWKTQDLCERLRAHPRRHRELFWFDNASDTALQHLYGACTGTLVASEAEGFGLPLVEALSHGMPVLARDLPVFRGHAHPQLEFFDGQLATEALAARIQSWLDRHAHAERPAPHHLATWDECAQAVWNALDGGSVPAPRAGPAPAHTAPGAQVRTISASSEEVLPESRAL